MKEIVFKRDFIGVVSEAKKDNTALVTFIISTDDGNSCGVIKYVGPAKELSHNGFFVGLKVYFGTKRQQITMGGEVVQVMTPDNIFAIESDEK